MTRNTINQFGVLIMLLILFGCISKPSETVISSASNVIDSKGLEFNLNQPLKRKFSSGSIRIELNESWHPLPPWTSIQLNDGRLAKVTVSLIAADGEIYIASILGSAGGILNARFEPEIPKESAITKINVSSDVPLKCRRIVWYDFNAK